MATALAMELPAVLRTVLNTPIPLTCFDGLGKRKNVRLFQMDLRYDPPVVQWKKLTQKKPKKDKMLPLMGVHDGPLLPDGKQLFDQTDVDRSGEQYLYRPQRGLF